MRSRRVRLRGPHGEVRVTQSPDDGGQHVVAVRRGRAERPPGKGDLGLQSPHEQAPAHGDGLERLPADQEGNAGTVAPTTSVSHTMLVPGTGFVPGMSDSTLKLICCGGQPNCPAVSWS